MARRPPIRFEGTRTVDGTLAQFEKLMDPQRWQENYPSLWPTSRLVDGDLPPDRDTDPPLKRIQDQFEDELFFEEVAVSLLAR